MRPDSPKLRDDLQFSRIELEGETQVIIYDPVLNRYHQIGELQERLLKKLDGRRTLSEVCAEVGEEANVELPLEVLRSFVAESRSLFLFDAASSGRFSPEQGRKVWRYVKRQLDRAGFVLREGSGTASAQRERRSRLDVGQLFELAIGHLRRGDPVQAARHLYAVMELAPDNARAAYLLRVVQRGALLARKPEQGPLALRLSLFDPDRFLAWLSRRIGFLVSPWFYGLLLLTFVIGAVLVAQRYEELVHDVTLMPALMRRHPFLAFSFWIWFPFLALGHELCHGLACKKYGGRVPEIGLIFFLYVFPTAYCDTSATYTFRSTARRVGVSLAGVAWQLACYLPSVLVFFNSPPGSPVRAVALMMLMSCWGIVLMALVPFLKGDGYYALADALGVPNLFDLSHRFWTDRLQRWLLGIWPAKPEEVPAGRKLAVAIYGILNVATLAALTLSAYVVVTLPLMTTLFRGPGMLLATALPLTLLLGPSRRLLQVLRARWAEVRRSPRAGVTAAGLLGMLVFAALVPLPRSVTLPFALAGDDSTALRAPSDGALLELRVREGDAVRAGEVVAVLDPSAATRRLAAARSKVAQARAELEGIRAAPGGEQALALAKVVQATRRLEQIEARRLERARALGAEGLVGARQLEADAMRHASAKGREADAMARLALAGARPQAEEVKARERVVRSAEAEVAASEQALEELSIRAPRDGRVSWALIPRGEVSTPGRAVRKGEVIAQITAETLVAELDAPLEYSELLSGGQRVHLHLEGVSPPPIVVRLAPPAAAHAREAGTDPVLATGLMTRLGGGKPLEARTSVRLKTEPLHLTAFSLEGARGRARVELERSTLLGRLAWQCAYFAGYYWWSIW